MKLFLKYLIIFFLPIIIVGIFCEVLLRQIPNDYSYKDSYLIENSNNIKTLFLGNSHIYFGVNPEYFKSKSFNLAHTSQSLDYDLALLKKYSKDLKKLENIIIPIDYFTLRSNLASGVESWRMKNYAIYYGITKSYKPKYLAEIFANKLSTNIERIASFCIYEENRINCNSLGWGMTYNSKGNKDLLLTGKTAADRHTLPDTALFASNLIILDEIIAVAKAKKCKIFFVMCPVYSTYVKNIDQEQLKETKMVVDQLLKAHNNVKFFDLLTDPTFIKEDFYDADHLNEIGAKKFTLKMDHLINTKF